MAASQQDNGKHTPVVTTRVDGSIYHVVLSRPDKRNAVNRAMMEALETAFRAVDTISGVRAVIVSGEGPVFSAGIDLMDLGQSDFASGNGNPGRMLRRFAERYQQTLNVIENTELPIIGALHGQVLGLGLELALAFDFRIAETDCKFALPETRLGLIADVGGTTRLTKLIGPSRTKDMLMTARRVETQEALLWGLINQVAEPGQCMARAEALANQIAQNAPLAVGLAKLVVDQGDGLPKASQMAIERLAQAQLVGTKDFGEAVASFLEKRPAEFKGV